jgi:hypothetical protein
MARTTAHALNRVGYVKIVNYVSGNRAAVCLTTEGKAYVDSKSGPSSGPSSMADKIIKARVRFRAALDDYASTGPSATALREALALVDVLAEACLKMLDEMEKRK